MLSNFGMIYLQLGCVSFKKLLEVTLVDELGSLSNNNIIFILTKCKNLVSCNLTTKLNQLLF